PGADVLLPSPARAAPRSFHWSTHRHVAGPNVIPHVNAHWPVIVPHVPPHVAPSAAPQARAFPEAYHVVFAALAPFRHLARAAIAAMGRLAATRPRADSRRRAPGRRQFLPFVSLELLLVATGARPARLPL